MGKVTNFKLPSLNKVAGGIKNVAKQTANNLVNGGTGKYKRNTVKEAIANVKAAPRAIKKAIKTGNPFALQGKKTK